MGFQSGFLYWTNFENEARLAEYKPVVQLQELINNNIDVHLQ